jgi:hypothetical protein
MEELVRAETLKVGLEGIVQAAARPDKPGQRAVHDTSAQLLQGRRTT